METPSIAGLRQQAELLAALSINHLTSATRRRLADDDLSVNAYPTDAGGFVYVGTPRYRIPTEPDLAAIFEAAEQAGVAWLMFDREAAVVDGLPVFEVAQASRSITASAIAVSSGVCDTKNSRA
jgi:hypothetical protein